MTPTETKIYRDYKKIINPDVFLSEVIPRRTKISDLMNSYKNILIDGFGTLYRREKVFEDSIDFLARCRTQGIEIRLLTNTSSQPATELAHDLQAKGLEFHPHEIISSGSLLKELAQGLNLKECFHLGKNSALPLFEEAKINCVKDTQSRVVVLSSFLSDAEEMEIEMAKAREILKKPGSLLITLNPDAYAPSSDTDKIPVSGYYSRILIKNTKCKSLFLGKPFSLIFTKGIHSLVPNLGATLMVGDTVGTDILGAAHSGIPSALILRGNTREEEMREDFYQLGVQPNYIIDDLS